MVVDGGATRPNSAASVVASFCRLSFLAVVAVVAGVAVIAIAVVVVGVVFSTMTILSLARLLTTASIGGGGPG